MSLYIFGDVAACRRVAALRHAATSPNIYNDVQIKLPDDGR